jgi:4-hydroxythreonine-4-phosphate dehydrogenase
VLIKIAISTGDPNGIGPEIVIKLLRQIRLDNIAVLLIGHPDIFEFYADPQQPVCGITLTDSAVRINTAGIYVLPPGSDTVVPEPGKIGARSGAYAMKCVETGIQLCMNGQVHALLTAPISKEAIQLGGYNVPGHTEFLAKMTGDADVLMMMVSDTMRVALATGHIPISDVAGSLSTGLLMKRLKTLNSSLITDFGIVSPRIAVTGLNPHAGDGGILGREEIDVIIPALEQAKDAGINAEGPFPADAFFARKSAEPYDAVLAMYHDQGLIPFKSTDDGRGVNFTAGLPIVRTSPDHGTAFDIAGKDIADPASIVAAFNLALTLSKNRTHSQNSNNLQ